MSKTQALHGKQGAATLIVLMASVGWVSWILMCTIYGSSKSPWTFAPDFLVLIWVLGFLVSPAVTIYLAWAISRDEGERYTIGYSAVIMYGCSPWIFLLGSALSSLVLQ